MLRVDHVAIVGGGFSGALLAINLLRHGTVRVTLIERRPDRLGRGLAYGAAQEDHVLNVRAANMSALPDQPGHFAEWLGTRSLGQEGSFARRRDYGAYLCAMLDEMRSLAGDRLTILQDEAVDLTTAADGAFLTLKSGNRFTADVAVVASGNLPPHDLPALVGKGRPAYVNDPWATDIAQGLGAQDSVLLLGSGLTAVDCTLSLDSGGFKGRIIAISRRGLAPHAHAQTHPYAVRGERLNGPASGLVHAVRARSAEIGWRNAVDELRPFTQDMWRAASPAERSRFLRHLRPYWDVHRHRIAPEVAARLDALQVEGRLKVRAAKIVAAQNDGDELAVDLRPRCHAAIETVRVARVVNCTGPLGDLRRVKDPLLRNLFDRGDIRPDPLAIGIDVDRQCHAIDASGNAQERLLIVGPMTRGAHWEIVAVPDIRRQVWALARQLTSAHWVEAEGL
ncbi:FAD-dependent oxidoreductase [Sphingobium lactosutens]|uniref:FAD/NAD(P)-binding protein n=1 Tax=Sphingobium lactosutens TaxID=522773 RepID=UPI0015C12245|nr:FAD/NAD(P)-binding protein [Sphingobium lactosutens]NWK98952.1 FAD-dependent oxidoreductase [Sphingobium lactosutens]